ncbi:Spc7-domain-containing protein [Patellaria atrata CBS 101060]|uniref:Spc7-domain-containing protein n=1 Tax=Patellaria atrata CBS 101060 TaxID=1346257 RepID=A0A9P4S139_9PEZI|nr:Spc7-domain-containing protein [Patellaria atrata CBS 101060]
MDNSSAMSADQNKENIADGLVIATTKTKSPAASPVKHAKKTRSKSIGPGGLEETHLKESTGNRRKSAFVAPVKSILPSKADEAKRRAARRKSLANRRVSFAPEATLHTWDVVEYLRDATTSSSSSRSTRRASSTSQASAFRSPQSEISSPPPSFDPAEPKLPSTPPEHVEHEVSHSSPANQRDLHQRKRRRSSSGIPPMNFNNPEDIYSSSPLTGSSSPTQLEGNRSEDDGTTARTLDPRVGNEDTRTSLESGDSTSTSSSLEDRLRMAAQQAGTRGIDHDESGELSMELAEDDITASFKPWVSKCAGTTTTKNQLQLSSVQDERNMDPSSPPFAVPRDLTSEEDGEMSMDMTQAVGSIIQRHENPDSGDATMDITTAVGAIYQPSLENANVPRGGLKRRRSSLLSSLKPIADAQGSPAPRSSGRRNSVRRGQSSSEDSSFSDATMDLTIAMGGIKNSNAIENSRRSSTTSSLGDGTMDFTMVVGGIKGSMNSKESQDEGKQSNNGEDEIEQEDLSMDFTVVVGGIQQSPSEFAAKPLPSDQEKSRQGDGPASQIMQNTEVSMKEYSSTLKDSDTLPYTPESEQIGTSIKHIGNNTHSSFLTTNTNFIEIPKSSPPPIFVHHDQDASPMPTSIAPVEDFIHKNAKLSLNLKSSNALSDSIKLLSTPRKQDTQPSPMKRPLTPRIITPKKVISPNRILTPKNISTVQKQDRTTSIAILSTGPAPSPTKVDAGAPGTEIDPIPLHDFLNMTGIRFMDLTTTKRRHTVASSSKPSHRSSLSVEGSPSLDDWVVAAACTQPLLEMYHHGCTQLKADGSGSREVVRMLEASSLEENPALFREYMSAPSEERVIMDTQFKNMKTKARLQSKAAWYEWRSSLLNDLKTGLLKHAESFLGDEELLKRREELLDVTLPPLFDQHERLALECKNLQQQAAALTDCNRDELNSTREQLIAAEGEIEEKRRRIDILREQLRDKERGIEDIQERKHECISEIREADRVREECRGWSVKEVQTLKATANSLEKKHGWSISSASSWPLSLTLTYASELQVFLHPGAFSNNPMGGTESRDNAPISLAYVGDTSLPHPHPLTTTKRFFLQLLRANIQCIVQSQTSVSTLLFKLSSSWIIACAFAENVRQLETAYIVEEMILSDEELAIKLVLQLPTLRTKIAVMFEVSASITDAGIESTTGVHAKVIYGEKYDEAKMEEFLRGFCDSPKESEDSWRDGVAKLEEKLIRRGRKE